MIVETTSIKLEADRPSHIVTRIEEMYPDKDVETERISNYGDGSTQFEVTICNEDGSIAEEDSDIIGNILQYADSEIWFVEIKTRETTF
jgi:hypothetical protein